MSNKNRDTKPEGESVNQAAERIYRGVSINSFSEDINPKTLTPSEIVNAGWVKLKTT